MNPMQTDNNIADEIAPGIRPMRYDELAKLNIPPPNWVVDKLIPDESITIMSALPAHCKTWLAFDIAIHVAHGEPLFGQIKTKQTKALIVDEESGLPRLRKRLQMLGIADDEQSITVASKKGFKITEASAKSLVAYCEANDVGLVLFDSLTRLHDADENSAKEMAVVMNDFAQLTRKGIAVILIHHNRKPAPFGSGGGATEMRGSVDIWAAVDAQISLKRSDNRITVTQNKNRDAEEMAPFNLEVHTEEDRFWFEYRGDAPKELKPKQAEELIRGLLEPDKRLYQGEIITALSDKAGEHAVVEALKAMVERKELETSKGEKNKTYYRLVEEQTND